MADLHQMQQVFLNMLNNSVHAIADKGHAGVISIASRAEEGKIIISITDNGDGILSEDQTHIFEPFFTTREVGKGAGLGLSICYGIMEDHGGNIRVESSKGTGTTIKVELPAVERMFETSTDSEGTNAAAYRKGPA
jgi:two-component system NtrC family sensor kinase